MRRLTLAPLGALLAGSLTVASARADPPPAAASPAEAEEAFKQGLAEMGQGRFDTGCPLLDKAHRLAPNELGVIFTLAECEWKRGRIATASARYGEFLQVLSFLPPAQRAAQADREKVAQDQRAQLAPEVPHLTLTLPKDAPAGTAILLDGLAIEAPNGVEVDPGEHSVAARLPNGATQEQRVTLAKGERQRLVLTLPSPAGAAIAPGPAPIGPAAFVEEPQPVSKLRWAMWTAGGVGVAGVAVGSIAGVFTFAKASDARSHCPGHLCDPAGLDAVSAGRASGTVSTIAFAIGGAGLGAAALIYVLDRRARPPHAAGQEARALTLELGAPGRIGLRAGW